MAISKTLLAQMYYDAYENNDIDKREKYQQQILDDEDFGEVTIQTVDGEELTITRRLILANAYYIAYSKNNALKRDKFSRLILDDADFGKIEISGSDGKQITVSHALILANMAEQTAKEFPKNITGECLCELYRDPDRKKYHLAQAKKARKSYRKNSEDVLNTRLDLIEQAYDNLVSSGSVDEQEVVQKLTAYLLTAYEGLVFYQIPSDDGKAKVEQLAKRAEARGLSIPNLQYCDCLSDGISDRLFDVAARGKRQEVIDYLNNPFIKTVAGNEIDDLDESSEKSKSGSFDKRTSKNCKHYSKVARVKPSIDEEYAMATFKSEIEDLKDISDEAKAALLADGAEIKTTLLYTPVRKVNYKGSDVTYRWSGSMMGDLHPDYDGGYSRDRIEKSGTYSDYGDSGSYLDDIGGIGVVDPTDAQWRDAETEPLKNDGDYIKPDYSKKLSPPSFQGLSGVESSIMFENFGTTIGVSLRAEAMNSRSYNFTFGELLFFPVYSVWIKSGGYIAYGYVNGTKPCNAYVREFAELKGADDFTLHISEKYPDKTPQAKKKAKKAQKNGRAATIIMTIMACATLIATVLAMVIKGEFIGIRACIPAVIALLCPKPFKGKAAKIIFALIHFAAFFESCSLLLYAIGAM